jgi:FemAB-related protein (PEP-CTERM system-associated)
MTEVERYQGPSEEWDAFVRSAPGGTHAHLFGWKAVVERVWGHECLYLATRDVSGALSGLLPLVRVRSALFGHYLVSGPFLNYGGPLGTERAQQVLTGAACDEARRSGAQLLELRSRSPLPVDLAVSTRKITVVLELPVGSPDALWRTFDPKVRSQIRRPQKEGVTLRFGADQVGAFFRVFARHMRDLGTPTHGRVLFEVIAATFPESTWFGVAWLGAEPIAAGCGFRWGHEFEITWAASLRAHSRIAPNMLLYWCFMERCAAEGLRTFNFGRCTPGSGTHRFKRQWGGRDEQLWWYQQAAGRAATPSPDEGRFRWGPKLWRYLPVGIATALGPRIVRYIP